MQPDAPLPTDSAWCNCDGRPELGLTLKPPGSIVTTARDQTIDIAKGIAIISIVLGHVIRGVVTPEQLEGGAFAAVDNILYSFHLAVFAFLSGLFVQRAVSRRGARPYLKSRVALLLYLYFVWTLIQVAVKLLTGRLANEPIGLFEAASSFWLADTQMWFFGFLVFATVYSVLIKPWGKLRHFPWWQLPH